MTAFYHFNFNVLDLERSLAFYRQALELSVAREKEAGDGSFKLVYLRDKENSRKKPGQPVFFSLFAMELPHLRLGTISIQYPSGS